MLRRYHVYSPLLGGYLFMDLTRAEAEARAIERAVQGERCRLIEAQGDTSPVVR